MSSNLFSGYWTLYSAYLYQNNFRNAIPEKKKWKKLRRLKLITLQVAIKYFIATKLFCTLGSSILFGISP